MMRSRILLLLILVLTCQLANAATVRVTTPLGEFDIEMLEDVAPNTVANFLNYVNDGDFDNSFIHRSLPEFIIQGGGFTFDGTDIATVPADLPVANEFNRSNLRGTVAMAKLNDQPDSATSSWFINMDDNSENLDNQNGGFTVFGEVVGDGMVVVDAIAALDVFNAGAPFDNLPLIGFDNTVPVGNEHLVFTEMMVLPEVDPFDVNEGVVGAWFNPATSGQGFLIDAFEVDGQLNLFVAWFTHDTDEPDANDSLDFGTDQARWFTASGPVNVDTAELEMSFNTGGVFNDSRATDLEVVGTLIIRFLDCTNAEVSFAFTSEDGGSGEFDIIRLTPDLFCQGLIDAAKGD
jgi:cyclophilin family peptidyl-prolyl cis-trans isomerase